MRAQPLNADAHRQFEQLQQLQQFGWNFEQLQQFQQFGRNFEQFQQLEQQLEWRADPYHCRGVADCEDAIGDGLSDVGGGRYVLRYQRNDATDRGGIAPSWLVKA